MVHLPLDMLMKNFILMTLVTATALSPVAVSAAEVAPLRAEAQQLGASAGFQRDERRAERRAERQAGRGQQNDGNAERAERRANRAERIERRQVAPVQPDRGDGRREVVRTERREATPQGRYYDRNRDGNLDRRWDRNRDGDLDRRFDRNRDGRLDRRLDRNDDERIDRRYDRNRNGDIDRRYDRNNDDRVDRAYRGGQWTNNWRNDRRYNWRGHRNQYRSYYSPGRYYSPYRGHSYRRFGIGISIGSGFYGSRYWINDPWYYRLPSAYGSYRWVRYYDDVLLVDLRSGRVVDVIYDFFW